jgi:predicted NAD-dependent protein-ADP-ribosyltransferase YbiA (DUF1768 family)
MVKSRINDSITYIESKFIDADDNNSESSTYSVMYGGKRDIVVAFGKPNHCHSSKGVIHYPMYHVIDNKTNGKIGVLEFPLDKMASIMDEDGDIDADQIDSPVFYDFVDDSYFEDEYPEIEVEEKGDEEKVPSIFEIELPIADDVQAAPVLFEIDVNKTQPLTLAEEVKDDAQKLREEYIESPRNEWIERFMHNNKYDIHSSSDCIFSVIRDAFEQIGQIITVSKLRDILAGEITDELYQKYRNAYLSIENEISDGDRRIKILQASLKELKKRIKKVADKSERESIIDQAKKYDEESKSIKQLNDTYRSLAKRQFGFVAELDTYAKFQDCIRTTGCCVDKWAFYLLERKLNIKLILLCEDAFADDSLDSVLDCSASGELTSPNFYIIVSYKGSKYKLVSYMGKRILSYREIPYDIRMLILNKCKERNSVGFNLIQDFRNLKAQYGVDLDDEKGSNVESESDTVFQFYDKSHNAAYPGMGSGETVPLDRLPEFLKLSQTENWRRKLDDSWSGSPFTLDNKQWSSVDHYYQGSKYKKGYPDLYKSFSCDTESALSKDPNLARQVGGKAPHELKPKGYSIDPDFYGGRYLEERDAAIKAKFEQHAHLSDILKMTGLASLTRFKRGGKSEPADFLMKLRKEL